LPQVWNDEVLNQGIKGLVNGENLFFPVASMPYPTTKQIESGVISASKAEMVAAREAVSGVEVLWSNRYAFGMSMTVEQIAEEALALPSEARALLADRLVESLDPAEDGRIRQLWAAEALRRRDDVRSGCVKTIPSDEALARVRRAVAR